MGSNRSNRPAFCQICRDFSIHTKHYQPQSVDKSSLLQSSDSGCETCTIIWKAVALFREWHTVDYLDLTLRGDGFLYIRVIGAGFKFNDTLALATIEEDGLSPWPLIGRIRKRPLSCSPIQDVRNIKSWITECQRDHQKCRQSTYALPTRVIDVGSASREPFLHISREGARARYIALSHRWGPRNDPSIRNLLTTTETLRSHCSKIPLTSLPKTFLHALYVTRMLGIRYLWIDSLCIIQGNAEDWARETSKMAAVYANSFLTLSADRAAHEDAGIFRTREDQVHTKEYIRSLACSNPHSGKQHTIYIRKVGPYSYHNLNEVFCLESISNSILDTRGWVLQESILPRRNIYFTSTELIYECFTTQKCDCQISISGRLRLKQQFSHFMPTMREGGYIDPNSTWREVVVNFSNRELSYESDRLPALSGLAATTGRAPTNYLAGNWRDEMEIQLLWLPDKGRPGRRHPSYCAPSWSWASVTGSVYFGERCRPFFWGVVRAMCKPADMNPFGAVAEGWVEVRSHITEVRVELRINVWNEEREPHEQDGWGQGIYRTRIEKGMVQNIVVVSKKIKGNHELLSGTVQLDAPEDWEELSEGAGHFLLLFAGLYKYSEEEPDDDGWPQAYLLKQSTAQNGCFVRVGHVSLGNCRWKDWKTLAKRRTVVIV